MLTAILLSSIIAVSAPINSVPSVSANSLPAPQGNIGDIYTRLQQLEEQNRKMQGRTEELEHKIGQLETKNQSLQQDLVKARDNAKAAITPAPSALTPAPNSTNISAPEVSAPAAATSKPTITIEEAGSDEAPKPLAERKIVIGNNTETKPNEDFEEAFSYMSDGQIDEARSGFTNFVKKYPKSSLSGEAYYWLGEMAYDEKDYNIAAINYLKGYREYPTGNKAPENILKLALTLKELGKMGEACQNLARFNTEFKTAHANLRTKADRYRSELQCK